MAPSGSKSSYCIRVFSILAAKSPQGFPETPSRLIFDSFLIDFWSIFDGFCDVKFQPCGVFSQISSQISRQISSQIKCSFTLIIYESFNEKTYILNASRNPTSPSSTRACAPVPPDNAKALGTTMGSKTFQIDASGRSPKGRFFVYFWLISGQFSMILRWFLADFSCRTPSFLDLVCLLFVTEVWTALGASLYLLIRFPICWLGLWLLSRFCICWFVLILYLQVS